MKNRLRVGLGATLIVGAMVLVTPAFAADAPSVTTLSPGGSGVVNFTWANDTGGDLNNLMSQPTTITLTAPANTTFPAQASVPVSRRAAGGTFAVYPDLLPTNCSVGNGGTTLTCTLQVSATNRFLGQGGELRISPTLQVASTAPGGTYSATSTIPVFVNPNPVSLTASLTVAVQPTAPTLGGIDNSSGSTVLTGTGQPGATVQVRDAAGAVVGTATVAADGTYSVNLGRNFASAPQDLAITQTSGGQTSAATTLAGAALPIIDPMIGGGVAAAAGLALAAAFGRRLWKRRTA